MAGLFQDFNPFTRVASNQQGMVGRNISRGSLISFKYPVSRANPPNPIHDPYPLVIITDIWPRFLRGVNLHYLTFPYIKNILQANGDNRSFSYYSVKADAYVANAFRMYYREGMSQVKKMDTAFLINVMASVRTWSPSEIDKIRNEIRAQIKNQLQKKAADLKTLDQQLAFTNSQNRQVAAKAQQMQQAVQGGVLHNLIYPQQTTGKFAANNPPSPGGPLST